MLLSGPALRFQTAHGAGVRSQTRPFLECAMGADWSQTEPPLLPLAGRSLKEVPDPGDLGAGGFVDPVGWDPFFLGLAKSCDAGGRGSRGRSAELGGSMP